MIRYGSSTEECYFLIKGQVSQLLPEKETIQVREEEELIKFYAQNFDDIIWGRVEEAEQVKMMA